MYERLAAGILIVGLLFWGASVFATPADPNAPMQAGPSDGDRPDAGSDEHVELDPADAEAEPDDEDAEEPRKRKRDRRD